MQTVDIIATDFHTGKPEGAFQSRLDIRMEAMRNLIDYMERESRDSVIRLFIGGDIFDKVEQPNQCFDSSLAKKELGPLDDYLATASNVTAEISSGNTDRDWLYPNPGVMADYLPNSFSTDRYAVLKDIVNVRERFLYIHGDIFEPTKSALLMGRIKKSVPALTEQLSNNLKDAKNPDQDFRARLYEMNMEHEAHYNQYVRVHKMFSSMGMWSVVQDTLHRGMNHVYGGAMTHGYGRDGGPPVWLNGHTHMPVIATREQLMKRYGADRAPEYYIDTGTVTGDKRGIGTFAVIDAEKQPELKVSWQPDKKDAISGIDDLSPYLRKLLRFG
jgi:hypothetical protein